MVVAAFFTVVVARPSLDYPSDRHDRIANRVGIGRHVGSESSN
jgi:hypothetical protein